MFLKGVFRPNWEEALNCVLFSHNLAVLGESPRTWELASCFVNYMLTTLSSLLSSVYIRLKCTSSIVLVQYGSCTRIAEGKNKEKGKKIEKWEEKIEKWRIWKMNRTMFSENVLSSVTLRDPLSGHRSSNAGQKYPTKIFVSKSLNFLTLPIFTHNLFFWDKVGDARPFVFAHNSMILPLAAICILCQAEKVFLVAQWLQKALKWI